MRKTRIFEGYVYSGLNIKSLFFCSVNAVYAKASEC